MNEKHRILLVDDEPANRDMLSRRLERSGFDIGLAENGEEALRRVEAEAYDLVLLDSMMPGLTGLDVLRLLRAVHSPDQLPVIMVTAISDGEHVVEALGLGANDYVTKPVDYPIALARIKSQLARKASDAALRRSEQRYALVAKGSNACLWDWDLKTGRVFYSERTKLLFDETGKVSDRIDEWFSRVDSRDLPALRQALNDHWANASSQSFDCEFRLRGAAGLYNWINCSAATVRNESGQAIRMAGSLNDIHESKVRDELTGIANRLMFLDRLETTLAALQKTTTAVLFVDVDRFKLVNDSWGHSTGDELLKAIAERLVSGVRAAISESRPECKDLVARLSGDEFGVLLTGLGGPQDALAIAERVLARFQAPFALSERVVHSGISIGISCDGSTAAEMLRDADTAMYAGKATGRGRVAMFTGELRQRVLDRAQIETDLAEAIRTSQIEVHYQPIIRMLDRRISGFEALARWKHPKRGSIPPVEFIPVAEETGLIQELGILVLRQACAQMKDWQVRFPHAPPLDIAVNVSVAQLREPTFVDRLNAVLVETGLSAETLHLEVTENLFLDEEVVVIDCLKRLRSLGIRLQIDDFGTGYSNLSRLGLLPFDGLKIDKALTEQLGSEGSLVASIISMVRTLGMAVVVEGVESGSQASELDQIGCQFAQGYFFARPVAASEAEVLIQRQTEGADQLLIAGLHPRIIPQ